MLPSTLALARRVDAACDRFESEWGAGRAPRIEEYLASAPPDERSSLLAALLGVEIELRRRADLDTDPAHFLNRFPDHADTIGAACRTAAGTPPAATRVEVPGYEILGEIGRGAMGVVYRARQARPDRLVALKMILAGDHAGAEAVTRFAAEADLAARLQHPNIVQVHEAGTAAGLPYFSLELVEGGSLADQLRGEPQPPAAAASLVEVLARAMDYAHARGVVHRDLKPANILLTADRVPKVADFGLARGGDSAMTATGAVIGTPCYMAPEQAAGRRDVGPAADVYALGAVLYEMLTGRPPFRGATAVETLDQVRTRDPVPVRALRPGVPRDLETVALTCLRKEPARRYGSAGALADDLRRFLDGRAVAARRVGPVEQAVRWARRRPAAAGLAGLLAALVGGGVVGAVEYDRRLAEARAEELVRAVAAAETAAVPVLVNELGPYRRWADPRLADLAARSAPGSRERLHAALALLPTDPDAQVPVLGRELLTVAPRDFLTVRAALAPHADRLGAGYWALLADERTDLGRWLRAAAALAAFDPADPRWRSLAPDAAGLLAAQNPLDLAHWIAAFRPVRGELRDPLRALFADRGDPDARGVPTDDRTNTTLADRPPEPEKLRTAHAAALVLADYLADEPGPLVELFLTADPRQLVAFRPRLGAHADHARAAFRHTLATPIPPQRVDHARNVEQTERVPAARRHARAALGLIELGDAAGWAVLRWEPEPMARTELTHLFAPAEVDPERLLARLRDEPDVSARRASLLALGCYEASALPPARRNRVVADLLGTFRTDPDSGVHSAAGWAVGRWGHRAAADAAGLELATREPAAGRRWYVTGQGQTLAVVPGPVTFRMGSPAAVEWFRGENEYVHKRRIGRSFAVSTTEVTQAQYHRFVRAVAGHPLLAHPTFGVRNPTLDKFSPEADGPANLASWYTAAMYCRWLSEREGVPEDQMCYPPLREFRAGMPTSSDLTRTGYRLPTEAEWEYACRAGATSTMFYGYDADRLIEYRSPLPRGAAVGRQKPNDLGLFDVYGNAAEWCHDRFVNYNAVPYREPDMVFEDAAFHYPETPKQFPVRGGSFAWAGHRSAHRRAEDANAAWGDFGFRVARTMPGPQVGWRVRQFHLNPAEGNATPDAAAWAKAVGEPPASVADVADLDFRVEGGWGATMFGIVAEKTLELAAGEYEVGTLSANGVRVFVDGKPVLDHWASHSPDARAARVTLTGGRHAVRVEYYQRTGRGFLSLSVRPAAGS